MTSSIVIDSNIFLALVLPDELRPQAQGLLHRVKEQRMQISAPVLFRYELIAVVRKQLKREILTPDEAIIAMNVLLSESSQIRFFITDELLRRAFEIANQFNFPTAYDAQYLAVAEHLQCEFWTGDKRLVNTIMPTLNWVKWLGDFSAT